MLLSVEVITKHRIEVSLAIPSLKQRNLWEVILSQKTALPNSAIQ